MEYYFKAPTQEELNAVYGGMDFEAFKQLSDEEVEDIRDTHREWWGDPSTFNDELSRDELAAAHDHDTTFVNFTEWRKHGVPDRSLTSNDYFDYMHHYYLVRAAADPNYGKMTDELFDAFELPEHYAISNVFGYFTTANAAMDGHPTLSEDELEACCGAEAVSTQQLTDKGVFAEFEEPAWWIWKASKRYSLQEPFIGMLLTEHLGLDWGSYDETGTDD